MGAADQDVVANALDRSAASGAAAGAAHAACVRFAGGGIPTALAQALRPITLVTGHYGTGKTNFALNLALDLAPTCDVTLIDLDIVNPYFRSSEYETLLADAGVRVVGPVMANSSLDTPSLSPAIDGILDWAVRDPADDVAADGDATGGDPADSRPRIALLDVGGDDAGAFALGRYRARIAAHDYAMLYVVNANRNLTPDPEDALGILREIEVAAGLRATGIVNNTHLRTQTTAQTVIDAAAWGQRVSGLANAPLVAQTVPDWCAGQINDELPAETKYPVQMQVRTPWE